MWWFWFGRINLTIASSSESLRITQDCSAIQLGVIGWLQLHFWQPCHLCKRRSIHARITQNASEITRWDSIWVRKLFFLCTVITWSLPDGFRMVHSQKIIVLCHPCPTVTISNCYCFIPYLTCFLFRVNVSMQTIAEWFRQDSMHQMAWEFLSQLAPKSGKKVL